MNQFWQISGIILWVLVIGYLLLRLIYGKKWKLKAGGNFFLGSGLMGASKKLVEEANQAKIKKETLTEVAVHIFWRLTKIGIFGIVIALIPFILLFQQNKLITKQNTKIDIQNNLIEAERRSSLVFLMSNVLDKVDDEIKEQKTELENKGIHQDSMRFRLSNSLIARIASLSRAFKPYRMLDGDTLSSELVSPERGQLFISLMESQLDSFTQNSIVIKGEFANAIIRRVNLKFANLFGANFYAIDLRFANLGHANLRSAYLRSTFFNYADLRFTDLTHTDLQYAYLDNTILRFANFSFANLNYANLYSAILSHANFSHANFKGAKNLTVEQLKKAHSLFEARNLPPEIESQLRKEKPCLFTEEGCPFE